MRLLCFIFCTLSLFSCSKKDNIPENVIPKEKIIPIIVDVEKAQALAVMFPDSTVKMTMQQQSAYIQEILKKHNTSEDKYKSSIKYYTSKPEELEKILDEVSKKLDKDAR